MEPEVDFIRQVRRLHLIHESEFCSLIDPHLKDLQEKGINTNIFTSRIRSFLESTTEQRFLLGFFNQKDELISTMGLYCWSSLPCATLSYMIVKKNFGQFNSRRNGLISLLHRCLEIGEKQGIHSFYSLQKAKSFHHKIKTWRQFDTELTKKYYSVSEYEIAAFEKPSYSMIWDMMDHHVRPFPTTLWNTRLKPEFEKKINWGWEEVSIRFDAKRK
jgi:hypothetical protein